MKESKFQKKIIDYLKNTFPECIILKNDSSYIQGIPDLIVLWRDKWASLECKKSIYSAHQPNQDYYVKRMDEMSFSSFIYPENRDDILHELELFFMNWSYFLNDNHLKFPKESHGIFSASNYHWLNYSVEKMMDIYSNISAKEFGTRLHTLACMLIENKQPLPDVKQTLNMYVNDAIRFNMIPEKQLYFSEEFRGTADALTVDSNNILRIFDLKTGKTKASLHQLEIYAALFCLDCGCLPSDFSDIEVRIYQNNDITIGHCDSDVIVPIMDKIITVDKLIRKVKENNEYGRAS